jgi:hypothetical protein
VTWSGEPANWFGELYCHGCHTMQYFVSWEPELIGPEHAECKHCGWKFPVVEETVIDPATFLPVTRRRSTLDPEVFAAAVAKARRDFIHELRVRADARGVPFDPRMIGPYAGPNPTDRR